MNTAAAARRLATGHYHAAAPSRVTLERGVS
jgi:hypothetical protein